MRSRRERLARAVAVKQTVTRLEQGRLLQIDAALEELAAREKATLAAVARDALDPRLADRQFAAFFHRRGSLESLRAAQLLRVTEVARGSRQAERLLEKVDDRLRREESAHEMRALLHLINASPR